MTEAQAHAATVTAALTRITYNFTHWNQLEAECQTPEGMVLHHIKKALTRDQQKYYNTEEIEEIQNATNNVLDAIAQEKGYRNHEHWHQQTYPQFH